SYPEAVDSRRIDQYGGLSGARYQAVLVCAIGKTHVESVRASIERAATSATPQELTSALLISRLGRVVPQLHLAQLLHRADEDPRGVQGGLARTEPAEARGSQAEAGRDQGAIGFHSSPELGSKNL